MVWSGGSREPQPLDLTPAGARLEGLGFRLSLRFVRIACIGEQTEGMAGRRETAHLPLKERLAGASDWIALSSEVGGHRLDIETARLLFDGDGTSPCRTTKKERVDARGVEQGAAAGLDTRSHSSHDSQVYDPI